MFQTVMLTSEMIARRRHSARGMRQGSLRAAAIVNSTTAPAARHSVRKCIGAMPASESLIIGQLKPHASVRATSTPIRCGGNV